MERPMTGTCAYELCSTTFESNDATGRPRLYCSNACRQAAFRSKRRVLQVATLAQLAAWEASYFGRWPVPPASPAGTFHALPTTPLPRHVAPHACDCCAQRLLCASCGGRYLGRYAARAFDPDSIDAAFYRVGLDGEGRRLVGPCCGGKPPDPRSRIWIPVECPTAGGLRPHEIRAVGLRERQGKRDLRLTLAARASEQTSPRGALGGEEQDP